MNEGSSIVVDTSALFAILLDEPQAPACRHALATGRWRTISAGTLAETLIVAQGRNLRIRMTQLIERYGLDVLPLDEAAARRVGEIYARWGRGAGTAGLNMGDCYAYEAATRLGAPLLFVGEDFARTDLRPAI